MLAAKYKPSNLKKGDSMNKILMVLSILLTGCVTGQKISQVEPGMNRQQVVSALGKPDGFQSHGNYEALKYSNRLMSGWSWDKSDYYVILKDGLVTATGNGEVRQSGPNMLIIVPMQ